jgi:CHASE3 domain sensor protein
VPAKKVVETSTLKSISERIRTLEVERRELLLEIDRLKRMADGKVDALEKEIAMLRDEAKSLRALLSGEEIAAESGQKNRK